MGVVQRPSRAARQSREPSEMQGLERPDTVVMRGLNRDPTKRFETAHDMAVALERCVPPASAAEVSSWLEQAAGPALARRADAIAVLEASASGAPVSHMREDNVGEEGQAPVEASSISGVSRVPTAQPSGRRRRIELLLAAAALTSTVIVAARIARRDVAGARSSASTAPSAGASSQPEPAAPGPPAPSEFVAPPTPPAVAAPPPSAVSRPRRGPAAPRPSDCHPPFIWDDQGKKHYKRNCL